MNIHSYLFVSWYMSYLIWSYLVLSYFVLSCLVLSILSHLTAADLVFALLFVQLCLYLHIGPPSAPTLWGWGYFAFPHLVSFSLQYLVVSFLGSPLLILSELSLPNLSYVILSHFILACLVYLYTQNHGPLWHAGASEPATYSPGP